MGIKKCKGKEHLDETLKSVLKLGGEGVMLRLPRSKYENKRSTNLLKVKNFFDEEAKVIGYRAGTGRYIYFIVVLKTKVARAYGSDRVRTP